MKAQFGSTNEKYAKIFRRITRKTYLASPMSEFLATIVVMILMYFGSMLALKGAGNMTPDSLIAFWWFFADNAAGKVLQQPLSIFRKAWLQLTGLTRYLQQRENCGETGAHSIETFNETIEYRGVWYTYNSEPVLRI